MLYACKSRLLSRKYNQFTSNYDSRVIIYEHKMVVRNRSTNCATFFTEMERIANKLVKFRAVVITEGSTVITDYSSGAYQITAGKFEAKMLATD